MKYWAIINNQQVGPMPIDQLLQSGLHPETLVWHEGLTSWQQAITLPELTGYFVYYTNPHSTSPKQQTTAETPPCPPSNLAWGIISTVLCCIPFGLISIYYAAKVESKYAGGDTEGAKKASESALIWAIVSFVCGLITLPFYIICSL